MLRTLQGHAWGQQMQIQIQTRKKDQQRSWLSLVAFCVLVVMIAALGSGVLIAGASVALAPHSQSEDTNPNANEAYVGRPIAFAGLPAVPVAQGVDESGATSSRTFAGLITDSRCGARHRRNSDKSSAECARSCVRNGARFVLVDGEKVYTLEGDPAQLEKLASERVSVEGMLEGGTIKVKAMTQN
jgi:hypothetical protein